MNDERLRAEEARRNADLSERVNTTGGRTGKLIGLGAVVILGLLGTAWFASTQSHQASEAPVAADSPNPGPGR